MTKNAHNIHKVPLHFVSSAENLKWEKSLGNFQHFRMFDKDFETTLKLFVESDMLLQFWAGEGVLFIEGNSYGIEELNDMNLCLLFSFAFEKCRCSY